MLGQKIDNEQFPQSQPQYNSMLINEREIGIIITKLEYLKDDVTSMELEISKSLLERKDFKHALDNVANLFSSLQQHIDKIHTNVDEINTHMKELDSKLDSHISKDVGVFEEVSNRFGKWAISAILAGAGVILYELVMRVIKPIFLDN
jgi:predicted  nucleic acid-binding Zn-ribbon protein